MKPRESTREGLAGRVFDAGVLFFLAVLVAIGTVVFCTSDSPLAAHGPLEVAVFGGVGILMVAGLVWLAVSLVRER